MPSFVLIHPFGHNTPTDRQTDGTDRQRSDNIGRTVLQWSSKNITGNATLSKDGMALYTTVNKSGQLLHIMHDQSSW